MNTSIEHNFLFHLVLCRYDRIPVDFEDLLSPIISRIGPTPQERPSPEEAMEILRAGVGAYITLSRYLDCRRCIWDLDDDGALAASSSFLPRLLLFIIRRRLVDGFMFVYSHNGTQSMAKQMRVVGNEVDGADAAEQTLLMQSLLFPPNQQPLLAPYVDSGSEAPSSAASVENLHEQGTVETLKQAPPSPTASSVVTELWSEPQNGRVVGEDELGFTGMSYQEVMGTIFAADREAIRMLSTLENVSLACRGEKEEAKAAEGQQQSGSEETVFNSGIQTVLRVPYRFDLTGLLRRSDRTELVFSSFVQEFSFPPMSSHDHNDKPNERLLEAFHSELSKIHDRELPLSPEDSRQMTEVIGETAIFLNSPSRPTGEDSSKGQKKTIKWKCYVKSWGGTCFTFVLIPASCQELRPASEKSKDNPCFSVTSEPMPSMQQVMIRADDEKELGFGGGGPFQMRPTTASGLAAAGALKSRKRTQSIDNSEAAERRGRRNSMSSGGGGGIAVASGGGTGGSGDPDRPQMRPRTHTFSYVHRGGSGLGLGRGRGARRDLEQHGGTKEPLPPPPRMTATGSVSIPVYAFCCDGKKLQRSFLVPSPKLLRGVADKDSNSNVKSVDLRLSAEKETSKEAESCHQDEKIRDLVSAFNKSRVSVLFHCLQQGHRVHEQDVQQAIDYCDNEIAAPVRVEKLLENVCYHVASSDTDTASCSETTDVHRFIKKKFADLIRSSFEPVPALKKFFFFRSDRIPTNLSSSGGRETLLSLRHRRDTRDTTAASDDNVVVEFKSEDLATVSSNTPAETSARFASQNPSGYATPLLNTMDQGSLSFMSHLDSETSESSFSIDGLEDGEGSPLFLQITASVKCGEDLKEPVPLSGIPTCLADLLGEFDIEQEEIRRKSLSVFVDLVYITFPSRQSSAADGTESSMQEEREALGSPAQDTVGEAIDLGASGKEQLPDQQRLALSKLEEEIEWAVQDETVFALTKTHPVTAELLEKVAEHISTSPNRPGCTIQVFPMTFVMAHKPSFTLFTKHMETLVVDGFKIVQCGEEFRYLISNDDIDGRPQYWLLLQTSSRETRIFFQYREGQFTHVLPWRQGLKSLGNQVRELTRLTNQQMLLKDLHETRFCSRLLEQEQDDCNDAWLVDEDMMTQDENRGATLEANLRFKQGHFACEEVWSANFALHPRLSVGGAAETKSLGVDTFRATLLPFSVANRENMYVYMDDEKEVFYMKVQEELNRSKAFADDRGDEIRSRTSSGSSHATESSRFHLSSSTRIPESSSPSLAGSSTLGGAGQQHQHKSSSASVAKDSVLLQVFGVRDPSPRFKEELTAMLQRKLDELVVDKLSVALQRNRRTRLTADDAAFLQDPSQSLSTFSVTMSDKLVPWLPTLFDYFVQGLLEDMLIKPKFGPAMPTFKTSENSKVYIFNQVKTLGGHRGIVTIEISCSSLSAQELPRDFSQLSDVDFLDLVISDLTEGPDIVEASCPAAVHFRLLQRGRVDIGELTEKLCHLLLSSLWDLRMELLLTRPIVDKVTGHEVLLGKAGRIRSRFRRMGAEFQEVQDSWLSRGKEVSAPSLFKDSLPLSPECEADSMTEQLLEKLKTAFSPFPVLAFLKARDGSYVEANEEVKRLAKTRMPRREHVLMVEFGSEDQGAFISGKKRRTESERRDSEKEGESSKKTTSNIVPRKCFVSLSVSPDSATLICYNVVKESLEQLRREWTAVVCWMNYRGDLLSDLCGQKLGLFHDQRSVRPRPPQGPLAGRHASTDFFNLLLDNPAHPGEKGFPAAADPTKPPDTAALVCFRSTHPYAPAKVPAEDVGDLSTHGRHMRDALEASLIERKMSNVFRLWSARGGGVLRDQGLEYIKRHSRMLHFCLTPLLFLPEWRVGTFETRAESAYFGEKCGGEENESATKTKEEWACQLTECFIQEYQQYIQTLGFVLTKKTRDRGSCVGSKTYLQKEVPGGILLFEIGITEPFFYSRLFAVEDARPAGTRTLESPRDIRANLVEEADCVKYLLHMHSYTYDFHVRTANTFLESRWSSLSHLPLLRYRAF